MKLLVSRSAFWVGLAWLRSANRLAAQEGVTCLRSGEVTDPERKGFQSNGTGHYNTDTPAHTSSFVQDTHLSASATFLGRVSRIAADLDLDLLTPTKLSRADRTRLEISNGSLRKREASQCLGSGDEGEPLQRKDCRFFVCAGVRE